MCYVFDRSAELKNEIKQVLRDCSCSKKEASWITFLLKNQSIPLGKIGSGRGGRSGCPRGRLRGGMSRKGLNPLGFSLFLFFVKRQVFWGAEGNEVSYVRAHTNHKHTHCLSTVFTHSPTHSLKSFFNGANIAIL